MKATRCRSRRPVDGEAAAIPETFFTVWHNVFERGRLKAGETLLVHGGTSGIGTTAIQLAKARGARVIVTAGSAEKCEACRRLGADVAVNYKSEDFVAATKAAPTGAGADVILDMVGGDYIERNYEAAAVEGRVVQIAFQGSPRATVDFRRIMLKRLHHTGSTLRVARGRGQGRDRARRRAARAWPLIAAGRIGPVIDSTFPLAQAAAGACAHGIERPYRQDRADPVEQPDRGFQPALAAAAAGLQDAAPHAASPPPRGRRGAVPRRPRNRRNVE